MFRHFVRSISILSLCIIATGGSAKPAWNLVWSDEFNQPDGSLPDPKKWTFDVGADKWGNDELEYYTSRTNNVRIEDGKLVIEALREEFNGKQYTSGRLITKDKQSWKYGRIEARIKIPQGQGIWPAFWMLATNIDELGWPDGGEIDIMENIGKEPSTIHGTIHGPGYSGTQGVGGPFSLPHGRHFADDFHVYAVEWDPKSVQWFVDKKKFFSATPKSLPKSAKWVFTTPQFLLLNVAVGGGWPGNPDASTTFPQRMLVDYVRVYQK